MSAGAAPFPGWRANHGTEQWLSPAAVTRLRVDDLGSSVFVVVAVVGSTDVRLLGDYASEADANQAARDLLIGQVPADWLT